MKYFFLSKTKKFATIKLLNYVGILDCWKEKKLEFNNQILNFKICEIFKRNKRKDQIVTTKKCLVPGYVYIKIDYFNWILIKNSDSFFKYIILCPSQGDLNTQIFTILKEAQLNF